MKIALELISNGWTDTLPTARMIRMFYNVSEQTANEVLQIMREGRND